MTVAVVFDLDGVVWDLRPHVAAVLGQPEDEVHHRLTSGGNVLAVARQSGYSPDRLARALAGRAGVVDQRVLATLDELVTQGCRLAAATSLSSRIATPLVQATGLAGRLEAVVCPGGGRRSKPAPDGLFAAAQDLGGSEHWYVGDTPRDHQAAVAAGWRFIWAAYGYGPRPNGKLDGEIQDITELPAVLGLP